MAEETCLSQSPRSGSTFTEILSYIDQIYRTFLTREHGLYKNIQTMLSTLPAKRFNPQRGKATNYECRIFNFIDCYQIGFKMTVELQRFVSWKPPDPPTPTAINQIKKIAYTDLEYPIKTFIAEKLQLYTPFCRTPESHSLYTALLRQFIETKVTSVTDVINKKFYIVIKK